LLAKKSLQIYLLLFSKVFATKDFGTKVLLLAWLAIYNIGNKKERGKYNKDSYIMPCLALPIQALYKLVAFLFVLFFMLFFFFFSCHV